MSRARTIVGSHRPDTKGIAELYETPPEAVRALMAAEPFFSRPQMIWEPACGPGQIVAALEACGHDVIASDKFDYSDRWKGGRPAHWGFDFLDQPEPMRACRAIVMNPPFSMADAFVERALQEAPRVYALLELGWLQGDSSPVRNRLIDDGPLVRVHAFADRLDMHRDGFPVERRTNSTRKHAWFCFVNRRKADAVPVAFRRISAKGA